LISYTSTYTTDSHSTFKEKRIMYTNLKFLNLMYAIVPDRIIRKYKKKNEILNKSTNWPLSDKKLII